MMQVLIRWMFLICCGYWLSMASAFAQDSEITTIRSWLAQTQDLTPTERFHFFRKALLGRPYVLEPLGEGPKGTISKKPLYTLEHFDCLTLVNTMLALQHACDFDDFVKHMQRINYKDGIVDYVHRNHFTSIDWNPVNAQNGFIRDITHKFINRQGQPIAKIADAIIDKPNWMKVQKHPELARYVQREKAVMLYVPLSTLFHDGKADPYILAQIPDIAIIEIVRPNWPLRDVIGTNLHVSHLGFAVRQQGTLWFFNASSNLHQVVEVDLVDYLRAYLNSETVKGINVQQVML